MDKRDEDEGEDYLDFITPPDYENPQDHNKDNIYEVDVEYKYSRWCCRSTYSSDSVPTSSS